MKDYKSIYEEWLANPYFDEATKEELRSIKEDENCLLYTSDAADD